MNREEEQYLKKLNSFGKAELERLIKLFSKKKISGPKNKLAEFLIQNSTEDIIAFFDKFEKVRKISLYRAKEHLSSHYPDIPKAIAEITNKTNLLIFLYEHKLLDQIDLLVFNTYFRRKELRYSYILTSKKDLSHQEIAGKLGKVTGIWNEKNFLKIGAESYQEGDEKLIVTFLKEQGPTTYRQFKFRKGREWADVDESGYEVKKIRLYPIWDKRIEILKFEKGKYKITFDFNPENEKILMNLFVGTVFDKKTKLTKEEIESVKDMQKEIKESISKAPKMEAIESLIEGKKAPVIKKIRARTDIPKEKKRKLVEIVNSLKYAGPSFKDDPKTTVRDFTILVEDFGVMKKVIGSLTGFIQEIFRKVPKSSENQHLYINKKHILLTKGSIRSAARLSEDEEMAIKIFFGVE